MSLNVISGAVIVNKRETGGFNYFPKCDRCGFVDEGSMQVYAGDIPPGTTGNLAPWTCPTCNAAVWGKVASD